MCNGTMAFSLVHYNKFEPSKYLDVLQKEAATTKREKLSWKCGL